MTDTLSPLHSFTPGEDAGVHRMHVNDRMRRKPRVEIPADGDAILEGMSPVQIASKTGGAEAVKAYFSDQDAQAQAADTQPPTVDKQ